MARLYSLITFVGLMAVPATFIMGWRYDAAAPASNYLFNLVAFVVFMGIHVIMLLPGFKKLVYGNPQSTSGERRIYAVLRQQRRLPTGRGDDGSGPGGA